MTATGRPPKQDRTNFGERIAEARERIGINQRELAERLGVSQRALSGWERQSVAIKPEQLARMAEELQVSADFLIGIQTSKKQRSGPVGKAHKIFDRVSDLPHRQQQRILGVVEDLLNARAS